MIILFLFIILILAFLFVFHGYSRLLEDYKKLKSKLRVPVTCGENTYDVKFTEKGVFIKKYGDPDHVTLAEINMTSAATILVNAFVYDDPK